MTLPGLMSLMYVYTVRAHKHCCPEQGSFFDPNHRRPQECGAASTASNQVIHGPILYTLKQLPLSVSLNASSDRLLNLLQVQISYYWVACAAFFERPIFYRFEDLLLADLIQFIMSGGSILRKVEINGTYISSSELSHSTRHQTYGYVIKPNFLYWMILLDAS